MDKMKPDGKVYLGEMQSSLMLIGHEQENKLSNTFSYLPALKKETKMQSSCFTEITRQAHLLSITLLRTGRFLKYF